ncbi:chitinase A1 precursor [Geobacter sp. OR-1]|nr:chitinase A1 precursor [Geobacter sp. OR-1]
MVSESSATPAVTASGWASTAPSSYTFASEGSKTLYAWAKDAAGNISSSRSSSVLITIPVATPAPAPDTSAPVVAINQVASPTTSTSQVISGTATDNVGVSSVTVQIGVNTPYAATINGNSWSINLSGLLVGTNVITVRANDASGNSSTAKTSITVENPPATLSIADATLAMQVSVGKIKLSNDQKSRLDVAPVINGKSSPNGKVDTGDAIVILSKVVGKIVL